VEPSGESDSYDDLSSADGLLFALDADDGYLTSFALDANRSLRRMQADEAVEVGPYSGVTAAAQTLAVSGGTSEISIYRYARDGSFERTGTMTGHRGHPDMALAPSGDSTLVSTHFNDDVDGHEFGVVSASFAPLAFIDGVGLPGAGFTEGGGTPASFPLRVAFFGEHAIVAHGGGLSVLRIDAGLGLTLVTTLELDLEAVDVAIDGQSAFVVGSAPAPRLIEVDLSDAQTPVVRGTLAIEGEDAAPTAVAVLGAKVFVAAGESGLKVVDR
jgi:hypothetical protein